MGHRASDRREYCCLRWIGLFSAVKAAGAAHAPSVVGMARKSSDMPCFKWINTILENLKTATGGTYHAFDFEKYGFLYLAEAQYRLNRDSICRRRPRQARPRHHDRFPSDCPRSPGARPVVNQLAVGSLGIDSANVAPCPSVLRTVTLPPCNSAIERTTASPSPVQSAELRAASAR